MLNYDVFKAFKSAGAPDEKAAAEALSGSAHASDVAELETDVELKSAVKLHTWMIGASIALNAAILARMFVSG